MGAKKILGGNSSGKLAEQAGYDAKKLAALYNLSTRQLERQFQASLGCSPQKWLNELKIFKAQELLHDGYSVKETSSELGYRHASYFCYQFKSVCGLTPKNFMKGTSPVNNLSRNVAIS